MAEEENVNIEPYEEEEEEPTNYKPPPEKSLEEMINQDQDDESLRKYKETLLGGSAGGAVVVGEFKGLQCVKIIWLTRTVFDLGIKKCGMHWYFIEFRIMMSANEYWSNMAD